MDGFDTSLAATVGDALREANATLAVAESCTGGLLGALVTAVPGSSDYFDRTVATYAYDAKRQLLAVSRESLDTHGAVSEPVAAEMAAGVRDTADVTWGVSTTGIAGPSGGTEDAPVGTVYVGVAYAGPWGTESSSVTVSRYEFDGDRHAVRVAAVEQALADLLGALERLRSS